MSPWSHELFWQLFNGITDKIIALRQVVFDDDKPEWVLQIQPRRWRWAKSPNRFCFNLKSTIFIVWYLRKPQREWRMAEPVVHSGCIKQLQRYRRWQSSWYQVHRGLLLSGQTCLDNGAINHGYEFEQTMNWSAINLSWHFFLISLSVPSFWKLVLSFMPGLTQKTKQTDE